jgi:hypothetical protein
MCIFVFILPTPDEKAKVSYDENSYCDFSRAYSCRMWVSQQKRAGTL